MWTIESQDDVEKRLKKFRKRWRHEVANVFANLETVFKALRLGVKAEQLKKMGFVHSEPKSVLAIDQKGRGKGARMKQFRLYIYPDEDKQVLHAITLGNKGTQSDDICYSWRIRSSDPRKGSGHLGWIR